MIYVLYMRYDMMYGTILVYHIYVVINKHVKYQPLVNLKGPRTDES